MGAKSHPEITPSVKPAGLRTVSGASVIKQREKPFFLATALQASQGSGHGWSCQQFSSGGGAGSELMCGISVQLPCCILLLYFALDAVLRFSDYLPDLWS